MQSIGENPGLQTRKHNRLNLEETSCVVLIGGAEFREITAVGEGRCYACLVSDDSKVAGRSYDVLEWNARQCCSAEHPCLHENKRKKKLKTLR
jgi:hypothetical protein